MSLLPDEVQDVEQFADWLNAHMPALWAVPLTTCVWTIGAVTSLLLFRERQFQVQLFAVTQAHVIPEHRHPHVDSIEIHMGGRIRFSHSGRWLSPALAVQQPGAEGCAALRGMRVRVRPSDLHGGAFGPDGGMFLSIQHWLDGMTPSCVAADYVGEAMDAAHFSHITSGTPTLTGRKCMASLEQDGDTTQKELTDGYRTPRVQKRAGVDRRKGRRVQ